MYFCNKVVTKCSKQEQNMKICCVFGTVVPESNPKLFSFLQMSNMGGGGIFHKPIVV